MISSQRQRALAIIEVTNLPLLPLAKPVVEATAAAMAARLTCSQVIKASGYLFARTQPRP